MLIVPDNMSYYSYEASKDVLNDTDRARLICVLLSSMDTVQVSQPQSLQVLHLIYRYCHHVTCEILYHVMCEILYHVPCAVTVPLRDALS